MTYGYEGQEDGFAFTSLLLSLCQELCLGCSVGDLVDGSLFSHFTKKNIFDRRKALRDQYRQAHLSGKFQSI